MKAHKDWAEISEQERAKQLILTSYAKGQSDFDDAGVLDNDVEKFLFLNIEGNNVLDFGCGLGRNFPLLKRKFSVVDGFDLPNMIELLKKDPNAELATDLYDSWEFARVNEYEAIFASLVLQHIEVDYLRKYLEDMTLMTDTLILLSRSWLDKPLHDNVLAYVLDFFDIKWISTPPENVLNADPKEELHFKAVLTAAKP